MHKYIIDTFFGALVAFVVLASVNWFVDPSHLFSHGKYESQLALELNAGKVIAGVTNYDERLLQQYRLEDLGKQKNSNVPETIVVGSSRSMQIHSGKGINSLNLSVSGATIEDYLAIIQLAQALPYKKIIIGVDPWIFNKNNGQNRWHSICSSWRTGMQEIIGTSPTDNGCSDNKLRQLANLSYTMASTKLMISRIWEPQKQSGKWYVKEDDTPENESDLIRPDGSRVYRRTFAESPVSKVAVMAKAYGRPPIYALENFNELDSNNKIIFEKLLKKLIKDKQILIYLPPYHPDAYTSIASNTPLIKDVEIYLKKITTELNIKILGSFDPSIADCTQEQFFDGMHPKDSCDAKILRN
jgi:hypothetical protein